MVYCLDISRSYISTKLLLLYGHRRDGKSQGGCGHDTSANPHLSHPSFDQPPCSIPLSRQAPTSRPLSSPPVGGISLRSISVLLTSTVASCPRSTTGPLSA